MRVFLVHEIESERGCGLRIEDRYLFPTEEKALEFVRKYNDKYNIGVSEVPDWYMMQEYIGPVDVDKELFERRRYKGDMVEMPSNWEYVE